MHPRDNYAIISLKGACIEADWRLFFLASKYREALKYCAVCPVVAECLEFCRSSEYILIGVWGGTTDEERKTQRQRDRYQEWLAEQSGRVLIPCKLGGRVYWPLFLIVTSLAFLAPEILALATNWRNTLSEYSWDELRVNPNIPVHTVAWTVSLIGWLLFVFVITLHIWWRKFS